ncbi:MAG: hypothetical protein QM662_19515 [Gordonia sp. (in: high G+C Gram-positive bacteria)]
MAAMTAAEFRVLRDRLGLTWRDLATMLDRNERTIARWEAGTTWISDRSAADLRALDAATADFIEQTVDNLLAGDLAAEGWLVVYRTTADLHEAWPDVTYPASWHRAAMGRVAERVPGARLRYLDEILDDEGDRDDKDHQ